MDFVGDYASEIISDEKVYFRCLVSRSSRRQKAPRHHRSHGHSRHRRRHRIGNAAEDSAISSTDIDTQSEFTSASYTTTDMESVADTSDTVR